MMVWLHTASPPQHIADIHEFDFRDLGGVKGYLKLINERRGLSAEFCGVFEDDHGRTSVQIFDTAQRALGWIVRNYNDMDLIVNYNEREA